MVIEPEDLELTEDDMYQDGSIIAFDDGTMILQRPLIAPYEVQQGDEYEEFVQGQDLTQYSFAYYDNSKKWWAIADVNAIFNPLDIPAGTGLIIPKQENIEQYYGT